MSRIPQDYLYPPRFPKSLFESVPEPDFQNAVKEAVTSLEAAVKHLFEASDFEKTLHTIRDGSGRVVPPTIVKGILAPYHFRGAAKGVAHGGADGGEATAEVAEWVLTTVAASIIYLRDIALTLETEELPF